MALNFLDELDITSTGDTVLQGFDKCQDNFEWLDDLFHGYARRSKFRWKDANEIYIGAGVYHHEGTVNQLVYWASELTFVLGKVADGGSNNSSDDLTASASHYIYIDDTAVVTAGAKLLTETEFLNDTTAPTWSASKHGWYNGDDRCIFAVTTSGASAVLEFFQSEDCVMYADEHESAVTASDIDATWTDIVLAMPGFSTRAIVAFAQLDDTASNRTLFWRTNGQTATVGHRVVYNTANGDSESHNTSIVITDSTQKIEVKTNDTGTSLTRVSTDGWYFPEGM